MSRSGRSPVFDESISQAALLGDPSSSTRDLAEELSVSQRPLSKSCINDFFSQEASPGSA
ncbi:hypothetical protein KIN20_025667 [Parelaphostrongylus tenuis]|uniref:Uncharacterized protein n=1 Tax=Parelaphostrongylus tenuis TaxID=148309 RepID=A0AAD5QWR3_PARTN|nr:hypothetical protein KIN20_025667 [Parelaphostrongylus tenuis]